MRFLLRLAIVLAIAWGGWYWWKGRTDTAQPLPFVPGFVQDALDRASSVESDVRRRVHLVQSGVTMIKDGKAMIAEGVQGKK